MRKLLPSILLAVLPASLGAQDLVLVPQVGVTFFDDSELVLLGASLDYESWREIGGSVGVPIGERWEIGAGYLAGWSDASFRATTVLRPEGIEQEIDVRTHVYGAWGSFLVPRDAPVRVLFSLGLGGLTHDMGPLEVLTFPAGEPVQEEIDFEPTKDPVVFLGTGARWSPGRVGLQVTITDRLHLCQRDSGEGLFSLCPVDDAVLHHVAVSAGVVLGI